MTVRAGELDRRITIRRVAVTYNAFNEAVESWFDHATVWAQVTAVSAAEAVRAQEIGAEISLRFTLRWSAMAADIDPRDRILFDGREYNITAVRDVGRRAWREIEAVARSDGAGI
jgi:SPP1 family predicted phage head-tail adaptor